MPGTSRPRRLVVAALTVALALGLSACASDYPNTTFVTFSEFGRDIDALWDQLLFWGTIVFVLVEAILIYTLVRYRSRPGQAEPKHVHGNTTLEIAWTLLPAVILILIAIPTVRTIFRTQAPAVPDALQVEVVGHQWWWEFRYPQFTRQDPATGRVDTLVTANEVYFPKGRTVNFQLRTADVIHSFWIPRFGGKRDLVSNHVNHLWFTPDDSTATTIWNGFCVEYCGASHANMKFRAVTVTAEEFERWTAHQLSPAAFAAAAAPAASSAGDTTAQGVSPAVAQGGAANQGAAQGVPERDGVAGTTMLAMTGVFPRDSVPAYAVPSTPIPDGLTFPEGLVGDAERGRQIYSSQTCIACHRIAGNPMSVGIIGPNLTHVGSRSTIGAGLYPNDARHLALWIKNTRAMKPGSIMPTLGAGQVDPMTGQPVTAGGLTDQQIADIVAYLQALQ
ncbi:MAG TPA: cytochrome c oxidase subunit II [Gemmatimonadaceae bacterium]